MKAVCGTLAAFACLAALVGAQVPQRAIIPGAVPLGPPIGGPPRIPLQYRQQRLLTQPQPQPLPLAPRRRPIPIKPVIEDIEEDEHDLAPEDPLPIPRQSFFSLEDEPRPSPTPIIPSPSPLPFRPEPRPQQIIRPLEVVRPQTVRPIELPVRAQPIQRPIQPLRQQVRPQQALRARDPNDDEEDTRTRKPVAQILRKYREDNPDGSITWGYENDDGSFKEETIGIDCITRGKYGYVDPDGNTREFTYETGLKCDPEQQRLEQEQEDALEEELLQARKPGKRPQPNVPPQFRSFSN